MEALKKNMKTWSSFTFKASWPCMHRLQARDTRKKNQEQEGAGTLLEGSPA
jgi:hypothetical protein